MRPRVVVLVSGGLDSCVTAALAAEVGELALLHATYGQRTADRERQAFEAIADHYHVPPEARRVIDLRFLGALGGSALTDSSIAVPVGSVDVEGPGVPITYVPFRNALLLSSAVSWAELRGAEAIYIGAVEEDSSGYPDCRQEFLSAFERAVQLGTATPRPIEIRAPLLHWNKAAIVKRGVALGAPLGSTWSCYQAEHSACGRCASCRLRLRGFAIAGVPDPIPYERGDDQRTTRSTG